MRIQDNDGFVWQSGQIPGGQDQCFPIVPPDGQAARWDRRRSLAGLLGGKGRHPSMRQGGQDKNGKCRQPQIAVTFPLAIHGAIIIRFQTGHGAETQLANFQYNAHMKISARNQLRGKVEAIALGVVTAKVAVRVGDNLIESVITRQSVEELKIEVGSEVTAIIKSTEVMLMVD
jgi:molybdopterin-binding protein